jgi:hypothetical protein
MLNADPVKYPEVLDNVVIVPEVLREFPADTFRVAYADLPASQAIAKRFGILKFPALLFLRQGEYVGIIAGLQDWRTSCTALPTSSPPPPVARLRSAFRLPVPAVRKVAHEHQTLPRRRRRPWPRFAAGRPGPGLHAAAARNRQLRPAHLPTSEEVEHLHAAKQVIAELIAQLQGYQGDAEVYPVQDISQLDTANRQLINQLLGEGEVSCRVKLLDGRELDMQESVFAGIWRVLESSADGQLLADRIEACPIPAAVWQAARAGPGQRWTCPCPTS